MRAARGTGRIGVRPTVAPLLAACALGVLMMIGSAALAYWPSVGVATASVSTATLTAPTGVSASATPGTGSVSVTWTGSTGTPAPTGYYVVRTLTSNGSSAPACGTSATSLTAASVVTCTDSFVPPGTYTYKVSAVFRSWTAQSAASSSVVVVVADHLVFTTQPSGGTGGTALGTQPVVAVQDAGGNAVTTDTSTVTVALTSSGGAVLSCGTNPKAAVAGVAAFTGCKVDKAGTYTLTASDGSLTSAVSSSFTITVGTAAKLAFTTQPGAGVSQAALSTQPVVTIQDAGGNTVTGSTSTVTVTLTTPGGATLTCTPASNAKAAVAGMATFVGCQVDKVGSYTLTAAATSVTSAASGSFTITPGVAGKLRFSSQPSSGTGGAALGTQPTVTVQDAFGNTVTSDTSSVTLALTTPAGATLACTGNPQAAVAGVATFSGCKVDKPGTYTLTATDGALPSAVSSSFTITVGTAAKLGFTTQPGGGTSQTVWGAQPVVAVQDAGGNTVTGSTTSVTLALTSPGGATLTCTANPNAAVAGVAAFAGCKVDKAGTYTLTASGTSLTSAVSTSFTITAGAASKLGFTAQPSSGTGGTVLGTQPVVAVQDAFGNTVTGNTSTVTLALTTPGGATLTCTPSSNAKAAVAGVAAFAGCTVDKVGTYTLKATDGALTLATSSSFAITAGVPSQLMYATNATGTAPSCATGSAVVGNGGALTTYVALLDAGGNLAAAPSTTTAVTITKGVGGGNAPTPASLTVLANASPAVTSGSTLLQLPGGNPADTMYTATSGALSTSCIVKKN